MDYAFNNYRAKKFKNKYFLTTDHGSYCILSENEFKKLKQNNINEKLKEKLEEREIVLNNANLDEAVRLMRNRNSFLFSGTSLHIIVVTLRCNMKCIYCHASSKHENEIKFDMDKETARKTVDFIFQTPNKNITIEFQGGEPLLNWHVVKYVIEYTQKKNKEMKKNLMITIVTNLTQMDKEKMNYLIKREVSICTSLDGPKKLHDYNRKFVSGSNYEQVVKWIKRFNDEYKKRNIKNRRMNALVTLTRKSLSYPKEIVDEYVKLGLKDIHLRFLNNLGVARQVWPKINYSVGEYLDFWKKAVKYVGHLKKQGKELSERMIAIMFNKINNEFDPNYLDLRSPCGAAIGQLTYNYDGGIYTCDEARMIAEDLFLLGNVKKDKYKDVVTCDKACAVVNASMNDQYICNDCVYKPYCGICPVCNFAEQGNVIGKITQTGRCKIFKKQFDWVVREKFINRNNNKK
jgi:His-Xaa-Ser system radical SAM maturase HxsB